MRKLTLVRARGVSGKLTIKDMDQEPTVAIDTEKYDTANVYIKLRVQIRSHIGKYVKKFALMIEPAKNKKHAW